MTTIHTITSAITVPAFVARFKAAFDAAEQNYILSAESYADAVATHGDEARDAFAVAFPRLSTTVWRRLLAVGNHEMDVRLLLPSSPGATALRRMSPIVQATVLADGVKVATGRGDHLIVSLDNLMQDQVRQVFSLDHVRDIPEQVAWMESNSGPRSVSVSVPGSSPWRVNGAKIVVSHACTLTRLDLARMLVEIG